LQRTDGTGIIYEDNDRLAVCGFETDGRKNMQVKQCEFCRMPHLGNRLCADCLLKLDEDFILVREYLYDHDGADIEEVSAETGVSKKTIFYLLKEERLLVGDENGRANSILTCESCKKPIHTGRMCTGCKKEVMTALQQSVSAVKVPKQVVYDDVEEVSIKGVAKLQLK